MLEGTLDSKILIISDIMRARETASGRILEGERRDIIENSMSSAGILNSDYAITILGPDCKQTILNSKANILVPLGSKALKFLTGMDNINKYHLSLLTSYAEFGNRKVMGLLHPETIQKDYASIAYIRWGAKKLKQEMLTSSLNIPVRNIKTSLDLSFPEIVSYLEDIVLKAQEVSTDIETDYHGVNCCGFAISPTEAIAIESRPDKWKPTEFHKLWDLYRQIWESENIGKIAQNALFEMWWASVYGIEMNNISFDTMLAMKYLHPTLERGLDNVGRLYTPYPYWKDGLGDWANISHWRDHLIYNGQDTTGQFMAKINMEKALESRGMLGTFRNFIMPQVQIAHSMQTRGLRLDPDRLCTMQENAERDIQAISTSFESACMERLQRKININSPKQVREALKEIGIKIPTSKGKETVSRSALMKLKNKHPKEMLIRDLIKINELKKKTDEYLNFEADPDGRIRFSMDLASDENGLWVGKKSLFNRGFDATSVPQVVKNCIIADEGMTFVQIRLNQPELRFIAKDAPDYKLQTMLSEYKDVNRFMASKIFRKPEGICSRNEIKIAEQVIKSANEFDAPKMFVEKCFAKTGVFYTDAEAKRLMQMFLEEFEGCRKRIDRIRKEMYSKRMLQSETRQITYYDRVNDSLVRRALSWGPETYSSDQISKICLAYKDHELVTRNHNSLLLQVDDSYGFLEGVFDNTEIKIGSRWGSLENV